jgi:RNA polymerase sigma-70 factor (ECF subfamily)
MAKAIDEAHSFHSQEATTKVRDFEAIYREHHATIWRFLLHLGVRESDVPDVTHNVFLIAHKKLDEFEHRSSMRTWLCGIALRVGRDFMRSAAVRLEVSAGDALGADRPGADDSVEQLLQKRQLALAMRLLDALPTEQREVFVLHELEQMTGPEIAELMATPVATVRSRLKRARDSFSARLAELRKEGGLDV